MLARGNAPPTKGTPMNYGTTQTPAEIDEQIAKAYDKYQSAKEMIRFYETQAKKFGADKFQQIQRETELLNEAETVIDELEAIYDVNNWTRFYLVTNGHIHNRTNCTTCYFSTRFQWVTELSGMTETDAVEKFGSILCSVCFPSAPVEMTNGESKQKQEARAEREAKKAERLAKKQAAALVPDDIDGGLVVTVGNCSERIKTIRAAKTWLTDAVFWGARSENGHGRYAEALPLVAAALAARTGSTPEAEIAAAEKRAKAYG